MSNQKNDDKSNKHPIHITPYSISSYIFIVPHIISHQIFISKPLGKKIVTVKPTKKGKETREREREPQALLFRVTLRLSRALLKTKRKQQQQRQRTNVHTSTQSSKAPVHTRYQKSDTNLFQNTKSNQINQPTRWWLRCSFFLCLLLSGCFTRRRPSNASTGFHLFCLTKQALFSSCANAGRCRTFSLLFFSSPLLSSTYAAAVVVITIYHRYTYTWSVFFFCTLFTTIKVITLQQIYSVHRMTHTQQNSSSIHKTALRRQNTNILVS